MATPNNAYVYTTGGVDIYVRFPSGYYNPISWSDPTTSSSGIAYLGNCEQYPETDKQAQWKPVFTADGGDMIPTEQIFMGELLSVNLDLGRFNQSVLSSVENAARRTVRGREAFAERGRLLMAQNLAFEMWLVNPFYVQAVVLGGALYPDMLPGLYVPATKTERVFRGRDGVSQSKAQVSVQGQPIRRVADRSFWTYSEDPAYFTPFTTGAVQPG